MGSDCRLQIADPACTTGLSPRHRAGVSLCKEHHAGLPNKDPGFAKAMQPEAGRELELGNLPGTKASRQHYCSGEQQGPGNEISDIWEAVWIEVRTMTISTQQQGTEEGLTEEPEKLNYFFFV